MKRKGYKDRKCKDTGTKRGETRRGRKAATRRESEKKKGGGKESRYRETSIKSGVYVHRALLLVY